jgi:hypothetical protein
MRTGTTFYRGAALLGMAMSLFFLSCDKELMNGGPTRIQIAIEDVPYGADKGPNRSAGGPKSETVVIPLDRDDDLCLYATLEENISEPELRAFTDNARLRIAVYDDTDAFVKSVIGTFSTGSFTLDGGETLDDVTPGLNYTFVAYSLNSAMEDPNDYKVGEALEDIDPSKDLLYGKSTLTTINSGTNTVLIPLKHKFSQVRLVAKTTSSLSGENITGITASLLPGYTANLPLCGAGAGVLVPVASSAVQDFDFPNNLNNTEVSSYPRTVYTGGISTTEVVVHSVDVPGVSGAALTYGNASFSMTLDVGTSYTLTVSLKESSTGPWAGSNIYWDGRRLTFDPMGRTDHALYSGVFFQWGSLVGVSASEYWDASGPATSTATLYIPTYDSGNELASTWHSGPAGTEIGTWLDIPNMTPPNNDLPTTAYLYNNSNPASYAGKRGDICRYLGDTGAGPKGYRMPKGSEFNLEGLTPNLPHPWPNGGTQTNEYTGSCWEKVGSFTELCAGGIWTGGNADGTTSISSYLTQNWSSGSRVTFPAVGCRLPNGMGKVNGELVLINGQVTYFTGSPRNSTSAYGIDGNHVYIGFFSIYFPEATPVRCIKHT